MKGFIICLFVVIGLTITSINAMDQEWLNDYQKTTGNQARFADSDDECNSTEFFDNRYGVCVKMRAFTAEDKL